MVIRRFDPNRAVEVIGISTSNDEDQYGSGYRIGGGLIITAAHLLNDIEPNCIVRAKQSFGETTAQVVWKNLDIALIELPDEIAVVEAITLGKLPETTVGERLRFDMYAYPWWARTQRKQGSAAGGRHIEGTIYLSDCSPDGLLVLEAKRLPPEVTTARSEWIGASGAAIICNGLVIAIQSRHQNPNRPASLEASLLSTVYGDAQWKKLMKKHGISTEPEIIRLPKAGVLVKTARYEASLSPLFAKSITKTLVKWTPLVVGVTTMAYELFLAEEGEIQKAVLITFFTACSILWVRFVGQFMEEAGNKVENKASVFAKWAFLKGDRVIQDLREDTVREWQHLSSDFKRKYYQYLIHTCRYYETRGLDRDQALNLQRMFVPLKVSQKSLKRISPELIPKLSEKLSTHQDIGNLLMWMSEDYCFRRLAILGRPGSGKTTLMRYLTLIYASQKQREILRVKVPKYIPVLMYLRDVRKDIVEKPELSLADLIDTWAQQLKSIEPLKPPPGWFSKKLKQNKCLILLDGLDEIANETERRSVSQWVDFQIKEYPDTPFILTSRPEGYKQARLKEPVTILEVQPFTLKQVRQFIRGWYLATESKSHNANELRFKNNAERQADDLIRRIENNPPLAAMAVNPLLLTMITTVHRQGSTLPAKRADLYKDICQVLLEKRQLAKGLPEKLNASQKQSVLQELAFNLMIHETRSFSFSDVKSFLQKRLELLQRDELKPDEFLRQVCEVSGLLVAKEEGVYEFAHLSFQEYLSSVQIRALNKEKILIDAIYDSKQLSWWSNTIKLYTAQAKSSNVIRAAIEHSTVETISLALDCVEEGEGIESSVQSEVEEILEEGLETSCKERFEFAAQVLLTRRLNKLLRLDEVVEIDKDYITCAEYQLFINSQQIKKKQVQPDHWTTTRFEPGTAKCPILGVSAENAKAFSDWLTQEEFTPFRYRLPRASEADDCSTSKREVGSWCQDNNIYKIADIESSQWSQWQEQLQKQIKPNMLTHIPSGSSFPDPACDMKRARTLFNYSDLDLIVDFALALTNVHALALVFDGALNRPLDYRLEHVSEREQELNSALDRALKLDRYRILNLDLYHTFDLKNSISESLSDTLNTEFNELEQELRKGRRRTAQLEQELEKAWSQDDNIDTWSNDIQGYYSKEAQKNHREQKKQRKQVLPREIKKQRERNQQQERRRAFILELKRDTERMIEHAFSSDRSSSLGRALNSELSSARNRVHELSRSLDSSSPLEFEKPLARSVVNYGDKVENIDDFQNYLLGVYDCLNFLISIKPQVPKKRNFLARVTNAKSHKKTDIQKYVDLRTKIVHLYCHLSILDLRKNGKMPVWEGIRIVRDRESLKNS